MSEAAVRLTESGELQLSGVLDYVTGPALRQDGQALIKSSKVQSLVVDCSAVAKSSSVGLSLLLAFMRDAQATGKVLSIRGLPAEMREIAQVCGVTEVLDLH